MKKLYTQRSLYDSLLCLALSTLPEFNEVRVRHLMGALTRKARFSIDPSLSTKNQIEQLLDLFYQEWRFICDPDNPFFISNLYLDTVLENKIGMPVSLGAILLYLAQKLALPIYATRFPAQLILRIEVEEGVFFIDPTNGQYLSRNLLQKLMYGNEGIGRRLTEEDLQRADNFSLHHRLMQLAKSLCVQQGFNELALAVINSILYVTPDDPYEIRDRGLILLNLGCVEVAVNDFEYFIEHCPEDPTTFLLKNHLIDLKQHQPPLFH